MGTQITVNVTLDPLRAAAVVLGVGGRRLGDLWWNISYVFLRILPIN
jgi:hypothetical protein